MKSEQRTSRLEASYPAETIDCKQINMIESPVLTWCLFEDAVTDFVQRLVDLQLGWLQHFLHFA